MTTNKTSVKVGALLLAAGSSSRLGQPKQQVRIGNETLLYRAALHLRKSNVHVLMTVLGCQADQFLPLIEGLSDKYVINRDWQLGMGNSLKVGLDAIIAMHQDLDGVLIAVCDQPYMSATHLNELLRAFRHNPCKIVASQYQNLQGVPAIFPERYFNELMVINDQKGAKLVIQEHADDIVEIPMPGGELDIDTPEDLKLMLDML